MATSNAKQEQSCGVGSVSHWHFVCTQRRSTWEALTLTFHSACISSIMRLVTSIQMVGQEDVTWGIMNEGLWS